MITEFMLKVETILYNTSHKLHSIIYNKGARLSERKNISG